MKVVAGRSVCGAVALAGLLGCSSATGSIKRPSWNDQGQAAVSNATGTTQLMSAQLAGPAPKVGKSHLAVDPEDDSAGSAGPAADALGAPKEARRSDRTRPGGHFGSSK